MYKPRFPQTVIDLFCGAGGLSDGFRRAGFQVLAGQEFDQAAGRTFREYHPESRFLGGSIRDISDADLLAASGLGRGRLDVLVAGPPRQAFAYYRRQRGGYDPQADTFRDYLRIVTGLRPRWLIVEGVAEITPIASGGVVSEITQGISSLGYRVEHRILRAEDYGIPQLRRRMIFGSSGNRVGAFGDFRALEACM